MAHKQGEKSQQKWSLSTQTLDVLDKGFTPTIINISKDMKVTMPTELQGSMKTMSQQRENINKETKIMKKNQTEILQLKRVIKMKKITRGTQQQI